MIKNYEKTISNLRNRYYFPPIEKGFKEKVEEYGHEAALNHLTTVMREAEDEIGEIINQRLVEKKIYDVKQTSKNVAGNGFQALVIYSLLHLQTNNLIPNDLVITLKPKKHQIIKEFATIRVQGEIQKPDIDLMIFKASDLIRNPILIFSLKTSLRERAGQTYKWKLLVDIASSPDCQSIREKYQLQYQTETNIRIGFITADFYEETYQPQQQGVLKFFDYAYVTKSEVPDSVKPFSSIIADLNKLYN